MNLTFHTRLVNGPDLAQRQSEYLRAQRPSKSRIRKALIVFGLAIFTYGASGPATAQGAASDTVLVSEAVRWRDADDASYEPSSSADGRYVAFSSRATNLSDADGFVANDVFVRDLREDSIQLVSRASGFDGAGGQAGLVSPIHLRGWPLRRIRVGVTMISATRTRRGSTCSSVIWRWARPSWSRVPRAGPEPAPTATSFEPSISADGRYVAFTSEAQKPRRAAADTNNVFVRDLKGRRPRWSRASPCRKGGDSLFGQGVDLRRRPANRLPVPRGQPEPH